MNGFTRASAVVAVITGLASGCAAARSASGAECAGTIVYMRTNDGPPKVLTMSATGHRIRFLRVGHAPNWSPDGSMIAFDNGQHIFVMSATGTGVRDVTPGMRNASSIEPVWSPDGKWIVFGSEPTGTRRGALWLVRSTGTGLHQLVDAPGEEESPSWSPDSKRLVFDSFPAHGPDHLYVVDADGTRLHRITRDAVDAWGPDWSSTGLIAFANDSSGMTSDIYTIHPDGAGLKQLTHGPAGVSLGVPRFSPDGRSIVFVRQTSTYSRIYRMTAAGTGQRSLTRGQPGFNGAPDWGPCRAPVE